MYVVIPAQPQHTLYILDSLIFLHAHSRQQHNTFIHDIIFTEQLLLEVSMNHMMFSVEDTLLYTLSFLSTQDLLHAAAACKTFSNGESLFVTCLLHQCLCVPPSYY